MCHESCTNCKRQIFWSPVRGWVHEWSMIKPCGKTGTTPEATLEPVTPTKAG